MKGDAERFHLYDVLWEFTVTTRESVINSMANITRNFEDVKKALDAGSSDSDLLVCLGDLYINGDGGQKNSEEDLRLHKQAANLGNDIALFSLALYYMQKNYAESSRWFKQPTEIDATTENSVELITTAMRTIGLYYERRLGIPQNELEALLSISGSAEKSPECNDKGEQFI